MAREDVHFDVLQNIEFAIVSVYPYRNVHCTMTVLYRR